MSIGRKRDNDTAALPWQQLEQIIFSCCCCSHCCFVLLQPIHIKTQVDLPPLIWANKTGGGGGRRRRHHRRKRRRRK